MASYLIASSGPARPGRFYGFVTKYPAVAFIAACVLIMNLIYSPADFADYYQYLLITDGLYYFSTGNWLNFEAGSNLLFLSLRVLTGNTEVAINLAHYLLGIVYVYFYLLLAREERVRWRGILVSFAFYGSLLAFITIRATPAYMLVTLGALDVIRGRKRGIILALAASLFHISAILAFGPILLGYAQSRLRSLRWVEQSTRSVAMVAALLMVMFGVLRTLFASVLTSVISVIPFLNKYDVYTASLDPNNAGQGGGTSSNHLIYAIIMSLFMLAFVAMPDERCRKMRLYVISSYVLFLILEFSPVTAFRQSQFWAIPAMLVFPWHRFAPAGFRAMTFAGLCAVMFVLLVRGVVV